MKRKLFGYLVEGILLSLVNLALLGISNEHLYALNYDHGVLNTATWPILQALFMFIASFMLLRIKKTSRGILFRIVLPFMICPVIADFALRDGTTLKYSFIKWIFLIVAIIWIAIRYEVDEITSNNKV